MVQSHDDNFEMFIEYIGRMSALIEESPTSNITIVGDFNAALDTQFEAELQEFCNNLSLVISDCMFYGHTSGKFTHVSNVHGTIPWLDLQQGYASKITLNSYFRYVTQL